MKPIRFALGLGLALAAAPALAQQAPVTASSPDGAVSVAVTIDGDGRAAYAVTRKGKQIIAPSRLGFLFTDEAKIDRRLTITGSTLRTRPGPSRGASGRISATVTASSRST